MTTKTHPLWDACKTHKGNMDIDMEFMLEHQQKQEEAFDNCVEFLKRVKRTKKPALRSYGSGSGFFKHLIESPYSKLSEPFKFNLERDHRCGRIKNIDELKKLYTTHVYKGTFNMAAKSMGFLCDKDKYYPHSIHVKWNIASRGLDNAILQYINCMIKKQKKTI